MRLTLRAAGIVLGLIVCVPLHYATQMLLGRSAWPRRFLFWAGFSSGLRVRVEGKPLERDVLFVSNHLSWLDILLLGGTAGAAFVSRDDVERWPVIGWLARINGTIFVARTERRAVRGQADALRAGLASGRPVALFPEGTTKGGHEVLPFRASLLSSLYPPLPRLKVQPVAIDYGAAAREIAWVGDEPAGDNAKRVLSRAGRIAVTLHFLEPVDPHLASDRKTLAAQCRAEILEALCASEEPAHDLYAGR